MISFVGAGPGAPDLITLRGAARLAAAEVVVWAGSTVPEAVLGHCSPDTKIHDSSSLSFEEIVSIYDAHPEAAIVRLHSGDPTIYSAIAEQMDWCLETGRSFEVIPGVSSMVAAAAAAGRELTVPGYSQSVVMTRLARRTAASVPDGESIAALAATGPTMALFLSAAHPASLQAELLAPGSAYGPDTPTVIAHRVSWPDEQIVTGTVGSLTTDLECLGATTTVMVLVGDALGGGPVPRRSHVYAKGYAHSHRPASAP